MGDRQYHHHNRSFRGGHGGGAGGYGGGYDQHGYHNHRSGGRGGRGGGWHGGEGRGGGRGGYGRGGGGGGYGSHGGGVQHHGTDGGRGPGAGGGGGYQRSYIGGKRGRDEGPEGQPPKLSPQHLLVAKLLGVCDRNTGSGRDNWTDERFFDDLLKSCRRDLEHGGDNVAGLLVEAAVEVSFKTQHYALALGILNTERPDFSRRITAAVITDLRDCLAAPEPRIYRAKQLLRYLAALHAVNVVSASWLLSTFTAFVHAASAALAQASALAAQQGHILDDREDLLGSAGDDGGGGAAAAAAAVQPWSDFLVYAVLAALPWCGRDLAAAASLGDIDGSGDGGTSLTGLLAIVESYMASRPVSVDESLRPMLGSRSEEDLAARSDSGGASFLGELWSAIMECRDNAWEVQVLPGPHVPYLQKLAAAQPLQDLEPLELPTWPAGVDTSSPPAVMSARVRRLLPPRGGIRLLAREYLGKDLPAVERLIVEEYVLDTLALLSSDRTACVLTLSGALPHHLASVFGSADRTNVRNFVAEALFSQMLRLPSPALSHAAYCTVLVDLCKVPQFQFARALSSCVRELFGCMPYLDPELRFRLASWLSYHLCSFGFQWPWDRWQWVSERPVHDPQRCFVMLLLHRLLRLADYPVVKQSLPPYFQALLGAPPALSGPPLPGNLPHHQPAHMQPPKDPSQQQQQQQAPAARRRGGPHRRDITDEADPDLLEDDQLQQEQQQPGAGPGAMQVDGEERPQPQPEQQGSQGGNGVKGEGEGGAAGGEGAAEVARQQAAAAAASWSVDPVSEAAGLLVMWCRQEGSSVAAASKARSLRPEQVAALWSTKVMDWLHANCGHLVEQQGPLATAKVLAILILAMGVKSPSHLHVAVERYAEAVRSCLVEADVEAGALGLLQPGTWEATAAALGASPGQMAMMGVVRRYHGGEPQRLLLVVDRMLALHVIEGAGVVAALFGDREAGEEEKKGEQGGSGGRLEGEREGARGVVGEVQMGEAEEGRGGGGAAAATCALSCFHEPVLCSGCWEVLLHALDRVVRMPLELPAELEGWEKKMAQLESIHSGVVQSVAAGAPGLVQRERDVAAQVEQASRCVEVVRDCLERSSAQAQDSLLLTYLGFVRLFNRAMVRMDTATDDESATQAESAVSLLSGWLRSVLRRYAEPSAALVGSGRLREELQAHEVALGGPPPEPFRQAVEVQLGLRV
ncbi:hypothetical protein VOLCADRAFT_88418 [Volvox carteri f. nagariensis]|uniref:MIF4G-like type 1 domain-containing protein n=1 Tax=Volvox carteri f. nagariensis TaxID=3068 RepID=D8TNA7_VOLCA|nr:uncharacterized protein VOLCADRAFT_88418 [Volvox carteri f. nagariensis]EFJ50956.1 hypothetical protein VOLCADRAFT_88418 [Volvox carteri f. nagariensis]|eukprot:XP_002947968.1 hypothetical protein VOLCADRAFT_88418 [Volvox carteri f. nagariensis]